MIAINLNIQIYVKSKENYVILSSHLNIRKIYSKHFQREVAANDLRRNGIE